MSDEKRKGYDGYTPASAFFFQFYKGLHDLLSTIGTHASTHRGIPPIEEIILSEKVFDQLFADNSPGNQIDLYFPMGSIAIKKGES